MMIKLRCKCGQRLRAHDDKLGGKARCPACGRVARVPARIREEPILYAEPVEADETPRPLDWALERPVPPAPPVPASLADVEEEAIYLPDNDDAVALPGHEAVGEFADAEAEPATVTPTQADTLAEPLPPGTTEPPAPRKKKKRKRPRPPPLPVWRRHAYGVLGIALLPLILLVFHKDEPLIERVERALREQPPSPSAAQDRDADDAHSALTTRHGIDGLLELLPEGRLPGSLLPRKTFVHWLFALASAGVFLFILILIFPRATAPPWQLFLIGLFTSTAGILLLLGVQLAAVFAAGRFLFFGLGSIFMWILKLIGWSYIAALHPGSPFVLSFLGFTLGVGLCEEVCKVLPVLAHFHGRRPRLSWQGACLWGLASGVGFGVAEGIMYSGSYYNGIEGGEVYLMRFVSCVALHAVWTAACGIMVYNQQAMIQGPMSWYEWIMPIFIIAGVPMVLHGLYDTLLKKELPALALLVALASFGWLAYLVETRRDLAGEEEPEPEFERIY